MKESSQGRVIDFSDARSAIDSDAGYRPFYDDGTDISAHIPSFELEEYASGGLSSQRRTDIENIFQQFPSQKERLEALQKSERDFKAKMSFAQFSELIEKGQIRDDVVKPIRSAAPSSGLFLSLSKWFKSHLATSGTLGVSALVGAAALFFFLGSEPNSSGLRAKGGGQIAFYIQSDDGARLGKDGEELHAGQRLQFALRDDPRANAMVIIGIDGNGEVSLLAGESFEKNLDKGPQKLSTGQRLVQESLILDDAIGAERFFVIYSERSLEVLKKAALYAAKTVASQKGDLQKTSVLEVESLSQSSVLILKKSN